MSYKLMKRFHWRDGRRLHGAATLDKAMRRAREQARRDGRAVPVFELIPSGAGRYRHVGTAQPPAPAPLMREAAA